jgi:hypothetical protein
MSKPTTKNPADVAGKWSTNLANSTNSIRSGVQSMTVSPTAQAARQVDQYLAGVQKAVADGKWVAGLNRVSLPQWQDAMLTKGLPRIQQGAVTGRSKMESFMSDFLPYVARAQQSLAATPRGGLEQNLQRMSAFVRQIAEYKRSR